MSDFPSQPPAGHLQGADGHVRRADIPIPEGDLDADLARLVRRTATIRQGFYCVVLLVALAGQVSGAVETLHLPVAAAIPAVAALELGGIVVLANADVRRRLGERAYTSRLLSAAIACWAVAFNWLAHADHLLGGFFAGMSALGYLVWLMHTENQRRDRLRVKGDLPPTTPAYELGGHWLRHPWLTMRAKALAKADPRLGLYDSLAAARAEKRRERRQAAIAKVLHRKIRAAVDPRTADIAIAVYDLDEIAARLAAGADYDGLTGVIETDLAPARLLPGRPPTGRTSRAADVSHPSAPQLPAPPALPASTAPDATAEPAAPPPAAAPTKPRATHHTRRDQHPNGNTPRLGTPRTGLYAVPDAGVWHSDTAIKNAKALRVRWPNPENMPRDPGTGEISRKQIGKQMVWSHGKVTAAFNAYIARADLRGAEEGRQATG